VTHDPGAPCGGWIVGVGFGVGLGLGVCDGDDPEEPDDGTEGGAPALESEPLEQPAAITPIASAQANARARDGMLIGSEL
jgi:hypothetical protein